MSAIPSSSVFVGTSTAKRSLPWFVVVGVSIMAFGPYVVGSIRTEQIFVYGLLVALAPIVLSQFRPHFGWRFFLPWLAYIAIATLGAVFPTTILMPWREGSLLGGIDNVTQPLVIMLLAWSIVPRERGVDLLHAVAKAVSVLMAVNGALAALSTRVDLTEFLRPFWNAADSTTSVADKAATLGRFSGIFNQPVEAGAMYGIAGLLAIYTWSHRQRLLLPLLTLIVLGGLVTVSKVFIIGALPLILFYWLRNRNGSNKGPILFAAVIVAFGVAQSGFFDEWTGFRYLTRLLNPEGSVLAFYTAGRISEGSSVGQVIDSLLQVSPLSGVGLAGWEVAYDSALNETLVTAGILGLICYCVTLLALFFVASRVPESNTRLFAYLFAILLVGSSLGFTPLTANRVSTIAWLVIALLAVAAKPATMPTRLGQLSP